MPLIQVRVIKDVFTKEQMEQIISKLTDAMAPSRARTCARSLGVWSMKSRAETGG
jgi:hypothetical protein